jgi:hypothetical protein
VTGKLSLGNKPPNAFLDKFRWERGAYNKNRHSEHLTTERAALPAGEWKHFDVVCEELEQYPHGVAEVVWYSNVISYDQETVILK